METWLFINDGDHTPAYNMAMDEALLTWHSEGKIPPIIRFYGWKPGGVSVGYFQRTRNKIDLEKISEKGFQIVRRPTGGKAVLHHNELTYSVIVSESHPKMPPSVREAYKVISEGLLKGFEKLGINADFAIPDRKLNPHGTANCFEESSWYEIEVEGKKAVGSAQTRQKGVILQHGSIPVWVNTEDILDLFVYPNEKVKARAKERFAEKAISISEIIGRDVTMNELQTAFYQAFQETLGITFQRFNLDEEQQRFVEELAKEKYTNHTYTYSR